MPKQYNIKKAIACGNPYLKVFLLDNNNLQIIKELVKTSTAVARCNITHNKRDDLTIYISAFYNIDEAFDEVKKLLDGYFSESVLSSPTKTLVSDIENVLTPHDKPLELYSKAITDLLSGQNYRNALDNLRLSVELLLKTILSNERSLEKQDEKLKEYLGKSGVDSSIIGIAANDLKALTRYFNEHVKHNDDVVTNEIDFVVYAASNLIHVLLKN